MKKFLIGLVLAAVSFGMCLGSQRRTWRRHRHDADRRSSYSYQGSYSNLQKDILDVHGMLKGLSGRSTSHADLGYYLDNIKEDFLHAYVAAKGGRLSANAYGRYTKQEQKKYIEPFDAAFVEIYKQVLDAQFEHMLERGDVLLDRAINLVISRHVAVRAGARGVATVQQKIRQELETRGIKVRGGRRHRSGYGYDEYGYKEESTLMKGVKAMLGVGAVLGAITGATYIGYRVGVDKENKQTKGFWNWLLPKNGTRMFSLGEAQGQ